MITNDLMINESSMLAVSSMLVNWPCLKSAIITYEKQWI